jgi:phenylalanyl-tRNA synthetase beta chain
VLLESARFDPISVRRTARALGVTSESSYRFERGVDPVGVEAASGRATALLCELAGGTLRTIVDTGTKPSKRTVIALDSARVNRWLGTNLSPAAMRTSLATLSCRVAASGHGTLMRVSIPSFRQDLRGDVDLAEELARLQGYDRLPSHVPTSALPQDQGDSAPFWRLQSLRCVCASLGLAETINWSLISETELARCGVSPAQAIRLVNPLSQDHAYLRPSLLMGLLQTVRRNVTQGMAAIHVFEVGAVASVEQAAESIRLGLALWGTWVRDWHANAPCDFFRLKGLIETLIGRLCHGEVRFVSTPHRWAEPTVSTAVTLNGEAIGMAGQVSRAVAEALDMKQPVWVAELSVSGLLKAKRPPTAIRIPATLPPVKRDLSISVDEHTPCEELSRAIGEVGGTLASHVELIDRYTGKSIPQGKYSLTFSIEYRDPARTLTAAEVDALHQRIGQALASRFGATLR